MAIVHKKKTPNNLSRRQLQRHAGNGPDQPSRKLHRHHAGVAKRAAAVLPPAEQVQPIIQPHPPIYHIYDDLGRLCILHQLMGPDIPREPGILVAVPVEYCSHNKSAEWHQHNIDYCSLGGTAVFEQQNVVDDRYRNKAVDLQPQNVARLNEEMNNLTLLPGEDRTPMMGDSSPEELQYADQVVPPASTSMLDHVPRRGVAEEIPIGAGGAGGGLYPVYYATGAVGQAPGSQGKWE